MGTFDQALIREIGRSYGAAISNHLLGDKHARPVRLSGNSLGSLSGGYKYENELDRIISTTKIKGGTGNVTSAQNVSNAYFDLVNEAKTDSDISPNELLYLLKKYVVTRNFLIKLWEANIEIKSDKTDVIVSRIKGIDEFIKEMYLFTVGKEPVKPAFNKNDVFWILGTIVGLFIFLLPGFFIMFYWNKAKKQKLMVFNYIVLSQAYLKALFEFVDKETYETPLNLVINNA